MCDYADLLGSVGITCAGGDSRGWLPVLVGLAAVLIGLLTLWWRLGNAKLERFWRLVEFLQDPDIRKARQTVLGRSAKKEGPDGKDDREEMDRAMSLVCSSYDVAGIAVEKDLIQRELLLASWAQSIVLTHAECRDFVRRKRLEMGAKLRAHLPEVESEELTEGYLAHFDALNRAALSYLKCPRCRPRAKRGD